ncbi:MAG: type II toxin-antitoxin system Phd/YefM family antitoxin [Fervidobacterium sp.]|nr:type II toxin-antitoxin system Phd/YefM family antitoxin [Fervidobacterium sp.]
MRQKVEFYSLADAKAKFSKVIEDSEGIDIVITKNGRPVSVIINYDKYNKILDFIDKVWELYLLDVGDPSLFKELNVDNLFKNISDNSSEEEV